jgi:succinoglycan biosynthesis protein ExoA
MTILKDRTASESGPVTGSLPLVSLVVPVRNEAAYIQKALAAIDAQSYPRDLIEIIVVDGGSTDGTAEYVKGIVDRDPRVQLMGGAGVTTPLAMNIGIEASKGSLIGKVDGHGWMNPEFVAVAQSVLAADDTAGCVGGKIVPVAVTSVERAISIARFSRLGVGGGVYTSAEVVQYADTVQCGMYRRSALEDAGVFDPLLVYGEDEELNHRLRTAGWRIVSHPGMRFNYRVRPTIGALFRQYYNYGRARVAVVRKHPGFLRPKHIVPAATTMMLGAAAVSLVVPATRGWGAFVVLVYGASVGHGAISLSTRHGFDRPDLVARSVVALHLGYGFGTLKGVADGLQSRSQTTARQDGRPDSA